MAEWQDEKLHELASEFFRDFARMEYALKATSFLNKKGNAEANWSKFSRSVHEALEANTSAEYVEAKAFILKEPPKKQIVENNAIAWSEARPDCPSDTELLLLYVRRVRNNLFHGGKFNGHWFAPERSGPLIEASLVILKACREASSEVNQAYRA